MRLKKKLCVFGDRLGTVGASIYFSSFHRLNTIILESLPNRCAFACDLSKTRNSWVDWGLESICFRYFAHTHKQIIAYICGVSYFVLIPSLHIFDELRKRPYITHQFGQIFFWHQWGKHIYFITKITFKCVTDFPCGSIMLTLCAARHFMEQCNVKNGNRPN